VTEADRVKEPKPIERVSNIVNFIKKREKINI